MGSRLLAAWKRVYFPAWTAPLALLLAALLCYSLRLPQLGFYWDDWPYLYLFKVGGLPALYTSLGLDRPALSWLYAATLTLLGNNPLTWQIFAVAMRWLLGCAFWFALRQAWPEERGGPLWAALLFVVYPGFTQQWISVVWGNAFVLYASLLFSLGLTAWAVKRAKGLGLWLTVLFGLALSAFTMFSTEYFFGLELLRPALVWLALAASGLTRRQRLMKTFTAWLPYLALMFVFVAWRVFFQASAHAGMYLLEELKANPLLALADLLGRIFHDAALAFPAAWGQSLNYAPVIEAYGLQMVLFALGVAGIFGLYLVRYPSEENNDPALRQAQGDLLEARGELRHPLPGKGSQGGQRNKERSWGVECMLLGLVAFVSAGWPVWVARLPLHMGFPWDRYNLSLSLGAALATAGLVAWAARTPAARALILALLIGTAAGFHNANARLYQDDWKNARELMWQLAWRAPDIQPGTALLADGTGLRFFEDDSLTGPLNWTFGGSGSGAQAAQMKTILMNIPERLKGLNYLEPGSAIHKGYRSAAFVGSTDQAVVLLIQPEGCLQVLDPRRDTYRADLPEFARRALPLSRPELLLPNAANPAAPPTEIFGPEPSRKWCYYYEKAALAAQQNDWEGVNRLKQQAFDQGYKPLQASEYLLFIDAALKTYAWHDARELSRHARDESAAVIPALCVAWDIAGQWGAASEIYQAAHSEFTCPE